MAERPDQIERHIESTRSELGSNLQELEHKVKQAADWRTHFERNPMTLMGLAFGGGVLLASMVAPKNQNAPMRRPEQERSSSMSLGTQRRPMADTWGTLKSALIGLTALKVRKVLDDALPGFGDQYEKAERENSAYHMSPSFNRERELESAAHRM